VRTHLHAAQLLVPPGRLDNLTTAGNATRSAFLPANDQLARLILRVVSAFWGGHTPQATPLSASPASIPLGTPTSNTSTHDHIRICSREGITRRQAEYRLRYLRPGSESSPRQVLVRTRDTLPASKVPPAYLSWAQSCPFHSLWPAHLLFPKREEINLFDRSRARWSGTRRHLCGINRHPTALQSPDVPRPLGAANSITAMLLETRVPVYTKGSWKEDRRSKLRSNDNSPVQPGWNSLRASIRTS